MNQEDIADAVTLKFNTKPANIMVVGDLMLDVFTYGKIMKVNPEAPGAPLLHVVRRDYFLGGAGNVATNIASLKGNVILYGMIGDDEAGHRFQKKIAEYPTINLKPLLGVRPTTIKTRFVEEEKNHQIARIDEEIRDLLPHHIECAFLEKILNDINNVDVVVLSDYHKGMLGGSIPAAIIEYCHDNNKPVLADFKPEHYCLFKRAMLVSPNLKEAEEITNISARKEKDNLLEIAAQLEETMVTPYTVITCGRDGMISRERHGETRKINTIAREVADVTGAGDTVIAVLALCMANQYSHDGDRFNLHDSAEIANCAAGIVVGRAGTATTTIDEIVHAILEK